MVVEWSAQAASLVEASPDAILCVDVDGRIVLVNAQAELLFGYERQAMVGALVEMLVPEAARLAHPDHRRSYLGDPHPRPMGAGIELAGRRHDGSEFPAEISLSAFEAESGLLVVAAVRDVTAWKRASEAQAQLVAIVRSSHDAIIGKTLDGVITTWNPGAERLYGYPASDMVGAHIDVLYPPERVGEEDRLLRRIARGEVVEQYISDRIRRDGSRVTVSLAMSPISNPDGTVVGVASMSRNASERLRAEAKLRGLLEAAPDAILGVDSSGLILLANAQAERLFGYRRDELIGQPVEILVPQSARAGHPGHRLGYVADPQARPMGAGMQLAGRRKDGTEFPAEISLSALETDDGLLVSAAVRDVTDRLEAQAERERLKARAERERIERQLHQSQRLESLGQLAGGVAHDFNNLLSVILNYSAFIAEALNADGWDEDRRDHARGDIEQIRRAADRATALTHQLLAFARREVIRPKVIDLNSVVIEVQQLLRRTIGEHITLMTNLNPAVGMILADPGQIEQVLVNLTVNARDAMPAGGTISIDTEDLNITPRQAGRRRIEPGHYVRLRVTDTGAGMPREVIDRAFEPFFTTKPKGQGTGLGLATVYGIMTQAGGGIWITSEPARAPRSPYCSQSPRPARTNRPSLLRPDRSPATGKRSWSSRMKTPSARSCAVFSTATATPSSSPRTAYEALDPGQGHPRNPPPAHRRHYAGNGGQRPRRTHSNTPTHHKVLYMSGYAQPILTSQGILDPTVTLVAKPFTEPELLTEVRTILDTHPVPA